MMNRALILIPLFSLLMFACDKPAEPAAKEEATTEAPAADAPAKEETKTEDVKKDDAPESQAAAAEPTSEQGSLILGIGKTPEDIKPGESNVYGANFTIIEPPITLASAIEKADKEGVGPYKVEATIEKVCQAKGCWFTLKGDGIKMPIRVKMKDYKFFVPKNSGDLPVVLEGTFKKTTMTQKEAQHYADDEAAHTGKPAEKITGPVDTWMFMASAVQIDKKKS